MIVPDLDRVYAVLAADLDRSTRGLRGAQPVDEEPLEVGLLEVDEGGELVTMLRQKVELEDLAVAVKDLAEVPDHALVQHRGAAAVAVGDLQRALGKADRPAAHADPLVVVEDHDGDALQPEV